MGVLFLKNLVLLSLLFLNSCTHLFFQPTRYLYSRPEDLKLKYENRMIESDDGTLLHSWYLPAQGKEKPKGLIVLFHGNAQNLSSHYMAVSWMVRHHYDVWVWDYRGYGLSQGEAESEGVYHDSLRALAYVHKLITKRRAKDKNQRLILVGQSLGGNILMRALADSPYRDEANLLVIDSSFISYQELARDKLASVWLFWPIQHLAYPLVSEEYSAKGHLGKIQIPTLVIHGTKDQVIPLSHGEEVYRSLKTPKKWFWKIEGARHIGTLGTGKGGHEEKLIKLIDSL